MYIYIFCNVSIYNKIEISMDDKKLFLINNILNKG